MSDLAAWEADKGNMSLDFLAAFFIHFGFAFNPVLFVATDEAMRNSIAAIAKQCMANCHRNAAATVVPLTPNASTAPAKPIEGAALAPSKAATLPIDIRATAMADPS